jgi:hypothetical protein
MTKINLKTKNFLNKIYIFSRPSFIYHLLWDTFKLSPLLFIRSTALITNGVDSISNIDLDPLDFFNFKGKLALPGLQRVRDSQELVDQYIKSAHHFILTHFNTNLNQLIIETTDKKIFNRMMTPHYYFKPEFTQAFYTFKLQMYELIDKYSHMNNFIVVRENFKLLDSLIENHKQFYNNFSIDLTVFYKWNYLFINDINCFHSNCSHPNVNGFVKLYDINRYQYTDDMINVRKLTILKDIETYNLFRYFY